MFVFKQISSCIHIHNKMRTKIRLFSETTNHFDNYLSEWEQNETEKREVEVKGGQGVVRGD